MKRKPIKIDWDGLDEAFNSNDHELQYYLDLVTGHVALEGEGEEDDFDEDDEHPSAPVEAAPPHDDHTRLYIHPPGVDDKLEWMRAFLDEQDGLDESKIQALEDAMQGEEPAEEIAEVLRDDPDLRDRWFLYRSDRLHEVIDRWLEENDVEPTDLPPWKA